MIRKFSLIALIVLLNAFIGSLADAPTVKPTALPTAKPTAEPTLTPTVRPTRSPTATPTIIPTRVPTVRPTRAPTVPPTPIPSVSPTASPTNPTIAPTASPTRLPTAVPTVTPTRSPTASPTPKPTAIPTPRPQLTNYPTGQPSSQPSMIPSGQPSTRPTSSPTITKHPTSIPTSKPSKLPTPSPSAGPTPLPTTATPSQPTFAPTPLPLSTPTGQPTSQPSNQPTRQPSRQPTSQPTSTPTQPSSMPTSVPTEWSTPVPTTAEPTFTPTESLPPTGQPSSQPSGQPTTEPSQASSTSTPTGIYMVYSTSGTVVLSPSWDNVCLDLEVTLTFKIMRAVPLNRKLYISTPGITSGPCTSSETGRNLTNIDIKESSYFKVDFYEGDYEDSYAGSYLAVYLTGTSITANTYYTITIDRSNELKRSCLNTTYWEVKTLRPNGMISYTGRLTVTDSYPTYCYFYSKYLYFMTPHQQQFTGINISIMPAYKIDSGTTIKVYLPGFTNYRGNYPLNPLLFQNRSDYVSLGSNKTLSGLSWSTSFDWTAKWVEGGSHHDSNISHITLYSAGAMTEISSFWIAIDRFNGNIIPTCGHTANDTVFKIKMTSSLFSVNTTTFDTVDPIGPGCSEFNYCNGHGACDFCHSRCSCYDGFGSYNDLSYAISNDFNPDCSSRTCPRGPSRGSVPTNSYQGNMHPKIECSNSGVCDRSTGTCTCFSGYTGSACEKMVCPGSPVCSGRGMCLPQSKLPYQDRALPVISTSYAYERDLTTNKAWDSEMGRACVCDSSWSVGLGSGQVQVPEYFGPACEFRRCPSGDDPSTTADERDCEGISSTSGGGVGESGNLCHVDCSNRGICDYKIGVCTCFPGYHGVNCGEISKYAGSFT